MAARARCRAYVRDALRVGPGPQVFKRLSAGGAVGIFPEGGSHDRTEMLPLKAGFTIMALGAMARSPGLRLHIVPTGLYYFRPDAFRSTGKRRDVDTYPVSYPCRRLSIARCICVLPPPPAPAALQAWRTSSLVIQSPSRQRRRRDTITVVPKSGRRAASCWQRYAWRTSLGPAAPPADPQAALGPQRRLRCGRRWRRRCADSR